MRDQAGTARFKRQLLKRVVGLTGKIIRAIENLKLRLNIDL